MDIQAEMEMGGWAMGYGRWEMGDGRWEVPTEVAALHFSRWASKSGQTGPDWTAFLGPILIFTFVLIFKVLYCLLMLEQEESI